MQKFKKLIINFFQAQALTARSFVLLLLTVPSLYFFGLKEHDVTIEVLYGALLILLSLIFLYHQFYKFLVKRRIKAKLSLESKLIQNVLYSKTNIPNSIILKNSSLPAFLKLKCQKIFKNGNADDEIHVVFGKTKKGEIRNLFNYTQFPHRGIWTISKLKLTLEDAFGFFSSSFDVEINQQIEVSSKVIKIKKLKNITCTTLSGEISLESLDRSGDLFDTKKYDPSDGTKRILWKTYAKSGELIVRHPEPSLSPEGKINIYCIANKNEDYVCGACLHFANEILESDIELNFGSDSTNNFLLDADFESINHALNLSVWDKDLGNGRYLSNFKNNIELNEKIIIFCSEIRFNTDINLQKLVSDTRHQLVLVPNNDFKFQSLKTKKSSPLSIQKNQSNIETCSFA